MHRLKIGEGYEIKIKKLTLKDFWGCEFAPLVFAYVKINKSHIEKKENIGNEDHIKTVISLAIEEYSGTCSKSELINYIIGNEKIKNTVFDEIYKLAYEDAVFYGELNDSFAYTVYKLCEKFGKLPTEILRQGISEFNLNVSILNNGLAEDYRNELISNLKAHDHVVSGKETLGQLERLLESKRDRLKNG